MGYLDPAFQPTGSTVQGSNGRHYLNGVDAINGSASHSSGSHKDNAGRYWGSAAERDRANVNIERGQSWRGADL